MTWTSPEVERLAPPPLGDERAALDGYLEYQRQNLLWKCGGLTGEQLVARSVGRSTLSLLGILRHLAGVERWWFRLQFAGEELSMLFYTDDDPNQDFDDLDPARAAEDYATYLREVESARAVVAGRSLDDRFVRRSGGEANLRWLYLRIVAEYAQHTGHADLLREHIDGRVGH